MMDPIRTLIIDDEPLARERIRTFLEKEQDFEIVGECDNGAKAIEAIDSETPDLIFLDVQMPEIDGFDVLLSVHPEALPAVIFITAYDQYAVRAFDVHALDYLLKPFDRVRFLKALDRARAQIRAAGGGEVRRQLTDLLGEVGLRRRACNRLLVKSAGRIFFLSTDEIDWIEAAGNYMQLHVGAEKYLLRETMSGMEKRLPSDQFVRIHRSTIVNLDCIREMQPAFNGEYVVILRNGTELKLSRKYRSALEKGFGRSI